MLQFEVEEIILPGKEDSIKPFTLFAQINHKRGENGEVILSSVTDLTIREKEMMKADPFGAAKVELYESVVVGKLQLQPQCEKYWDVLLFCKNTLERWKKLRSLIAQRLFCSMVSQFHAAVVLGFFFQNLILTFKPHVCQN